MDMNGWQTSLTLGADAFVGIVLTVVLLHILLGKGLDFVR
jgi:hypothetical protein